ncbi:MAG: carbon storage regulator [Pseudomonadota bacterium]
MLIFKRRVGETFTVGDHVTVTVVEVQNGRVRFAISAPDHIPVRREELLTQQAREGAPHERGSDV